MKKIAFILILVLSCIATKAQTIDERIGAAINSSANFGLYDIYYNAQKDSIDPFLEVFSRCLIGNRFNRPDISIPAFDELLKKQSDRLDLNLLLQSSVMYSMDLSRVGKNEEAYNLMSAVLSSAYQMVDSVSLSPYADMIDTKLLQSIRHIVFPFPVKKVLLRLILFVRGSLTANNI